MSNVLTWTVSALMGKVVAVPKTVANLPHTVYKKK